MSKKISKFQKFNALSYYPKVGICKVVDGRQNGNRKSFTFATGDEHLNGFSMLFNNLLTNTAQLFDDVCPEAIERVSDWRPNGKMENGARYSLSIPVLVH